ncbi:MAG: hypothetical protein ACLUOS_15390 [Odoribacter splanchnicus]
MGFGIFFIEKMHVVGGDKFDIQFPGYFDFLLNTALLIVVNLGSLFGIRCRMASLPDNLRRKILYHRLLFSSFQITGHDFLIVLLLQAEEMINPS